MKFFDRELFLKTITDWIRDGSDILFFHTHQTHEEITLIGKDGAKEHFVIFHDLEDFNESDDVSGEPEEGIRDAWLRYANGEIEYDEAVSLGGPLPVDVPGKTHFQEQLEAFVSTQQEILQQLVDFIQEAHDKGEFKDLGEFDIRVEPARLYTSDDPRDFNLHETRIQMKQEFVFLAQKDDALKELSLRQNAQGNLESV